eukprot:2882032-Prymnesium_polylepis.1
MTYHAGNISCRHALCPAALALPHVCLVVRVGGGEERAQADRAMLDGAKLPQRRQGVGTTFRLVRNNIPTGSIIGWRGGSNAHTPILTGQLPDQDARMHVPVPPHP